MSMHWTTACPDWEHRIVNGLSLIPCEPLFPEVADQALEVFKSLRIVDAPGMPTFGEAGDKWIFDFVRAVFGSYNPDTGERMINEFFLCVSKKNGKSLITAGIMLTALILNWRRSSELTILAPTIEAANNSFKPAADMVRADMELLADPSVGGHGMLHIIDTQRTIKHLTTGAILKIKAADTKIVVGSKAAFVLVDELWELGNKNGADAMLKEATGGLKSRPEGFKIYITTQSDAPPEGVFKDKLDYARAVRDGRIVDKKFMPVIYEFPQSMIDDESFMEPENYYITNPYLGKSKFGRETIESDLKAELMKGVESRNVFFAKHLNVEIGMNLRSNRWPGADYWDKRVDKTITFESLIERSEVITIGIDGGGLDDLFGLSLIGRERQTMNWLSMGKAWCHKGVLERRKKIADKLKEFEREGTLTIVDDELSDISGIIEIIQAVKDAGLLGMVACDPAGLGEMIEALAAIGVTQEEGNLIGAAQGWQMMNSIKTAERRLAKRTMFHDGSKLMEWCVANIKIEPTATAIKATKQNAGDLKIDPAIAMFNAVQEMSKNPEAQGEPEYQVMFV